MNPLAKEEYDAEKLRLDELATQRADLEASLTELEKLSAELKETVERRFAETFDAVQSNFHEVAGTLFPGGEGRLSLTDAEEDESQSGIEVELRPAGKKVQRLSLLSGGEKALGAISFLFALFLARPCPLRRAAARLLRPRAVRRDHAPETHDGSRRRPLRRHDGRRRHLADRLAPAAARRSTSRLRGLAADHHTCNLVVVLALRGGVV